MLTGWTPIRSASSSAVKPRSEVWRRISVRTLLPMVSIATSTSFGMSTGIDRRGIDVIVPDRTAVALSAEECKYRGLKDAAEPTRGGIQWALGHPIRVAALAQLARPGGRGDSRQAQPMQGRACSPGEAIEPLKQPSLSRICCRRPPHDSWGSAR